MDEEMERKLDELELEWQRAEKTRHEAYHRAWQPGMPEYCYSEVVERLIEVVPELKEQYRRFIERGGKDEGPYIVYAEVLQPHFIVQLELGAPAGEVKQTFAFVEELATHPDEHVQTLAHLEICDSIFSARLLGQAWPHMGERTRKLCLKTLMPGPDTSKEDEYTSQDLAEYNLAWEAELDNLGGPAKVPLPDVFDIRTRLVARYGFKSHWFYDSYENWDLYSVVNETEYRRRFKQHLGELGNPDDLYEWLVGLQGIRDRLFDELRPHDTEKE